MKVNIMGAAPLPALITKFPTRSRPRHDCCITSKFRGRIKRHRCSSKLARAVDEDFLVVRYP